MAGAGSLYSGDAVGGGGFATELGLRRVYSSHRRNSLTKSGAGR